MNNLKHLPYIFGDNMPEKKMEVFFIMGKSRSNERKAQTNERARKQKQQEKIQAAFNNPETEFSSEFSLAEQNRKSELERNK
ncbi:hypothetical protein DS031_18950 [Bacillus taeanensis]|uniref:Uncharacterized protein n=2 Tax=Bacillus taeanensis TaxID=273032 RepID=A0A366XQ26_9BACI|nr:hypothetical protein DS031_18950 [Bacillus taeanensis]